MDYQSIEGALRQKQPSQRGRISLAVAMVLSMIATVAAFPTSAGAFPTPTGPAVPGQPGTFLPAPNPIAYCDAPTYFGEIDQDRALEDNPNQDINPNFDQNGDGDFLNDTGAQTVESFTANSGPGGPTLTGTTTTFGGSNSSNSSIVTPRIVANENGVTFGPGAVVEVALSEPVFYSQWVFIDVDLSSEGFEVVPTWTGAPGELAIYGGDANFNFAGSTASFADFNDTDRVNGNGAEVRTRAQVDFLGPINSLEVTKTGTGGAGFAVGGGCVALGSSKQASTPVWNPVTGQFEVDVTITVLNNLPSSATLANFVDTAQSSAASSFLTGDPQGIDAIDLQVDDPLDLAGFSSVDVTSITSASGLAVNPNYDGVTDTSLLAGSDVLAPEGVSTVEMSLVYTPDLTDPEWADCAVSIENQAEVTAIANGVAVSDLSDAGSDPAPSADNGEGGSADPTVMDFAFDCEISLAKDITDGPTSNGDGTYNLQYTLVAENTGDFPLSDPTINDDLAATFGPSFTSSTISTDTCAGVTLNPGDTCTQVIDVVITPSGSLGPWDNSATVDATGPGGAVVSDVSQDGADADPDGDGDPSNNSVPTSVSLTPEIALSKELSAAPVNNGDGTYTLEYTLIAENTGGAYLENVAIDDDLAATFGAALTSSSVTSDTCSGAALDLGDTCTQVLSVTITPGTNLGPWENSAVVTADSPAGPVTDISQDGTDADPDGDGDPSNNSDPTLVTLEENPQVGLAKDLTGGPTSNGDGTFTLEYTLVATNTGDVPLSNVVINDDLAATFGAALNSSAIVSDTCAGATLSPSAPPGAGDSCTQVISVNVTPGSNLGPYENQATVSGDSPSGATVTDDSTDGAVADADGDGDPTNDTSPTPVSFEENPEIGLAKALTDGPVNNGDGTYTLGYTIVATNTGDVPLSNVIINDDLSTAFGAALTTFTIVSDTCFAQTLNASVPAGAGDACTQVFEVVVTPGADLGPYENVATVTGDSPAGTTVTDDSTDSPVVDADGDGVPDDTDGDGIPDHLQNPDPDGDGDPSNNSTPTLASFGENPEIGVTKTVANVVVNPDGTVSFDYVINVENTGDIVLNNVALVDDLDATFGTVAYTVDAVDASTGAVALTANAAYTGAAGAAGIDSDDTLDGSDSLAVGESGTVIISVTITPAGNYGPFDNTATAEGTSPSGASVTDDSNDSPVVDADGDGIPDDTDGDGIPDHLDSDPDGDGDPSNNSTPTPLPIPAIGTNKAITNVVNNGDGTYVVTYDVTVSNVGTTDLVGVSLVDDLTTTFATATSFAVTGISSPTLTVDAGFDGSANPNMLAGTDTLAIGESGVVTFTILLTPGGDLGPYNNTATASGNAPDVVLPDGTVVPGPSVDDDSQNSAPGDGNPDTNGDGDPTNDDVPTPLDLTENPEISVTKALTTAPVDNGDGSYTMTFGLVATNTGDVNLSNVSLTDDLAATFGAGSTIVVDSISATAPGTANTGFDGVADTEMLSGTNLAVGEFTEVTVTVTVTPAGGPNFENTAMATGASPAGTLVSDDSQDQGTDPSSAPGADADGDGDPTNDSDPTPITLIPDPENDEDLDNPAGSTVTINPLANDDSGFDPTSVQLLDPATGEYVTELVVPGEGTWTVDPVTGEVTFVPEPGFEGDPTPVEYRAQVLGSDVYKTAEIVITYLDAPDPANDEDLNNPIGSTVTIDPLANDEDGLDPTSVQLLDPATGEYVTELVVPGEGTWTVDPVTGQVTFVPEPGFEGDPTPVEYRAQVLGSTAYRMATITVTYVDPIPPSLAFTGRSSAELALGATLLVLIGAAAVALVPTRRREDETLNM